MYKKLSLIKLTYGIYLGTGMGPPKLKIVIMKLSKLSKNVFAPHTLKVMVLNYVKGLGD